MKRVVTLVAVAALIAGASTAWAANVNGTIKSIDTAKHELVLEDGKTYGIAGNVKLEGLNPGDKVKINAELKNGKPFVDKIEQTSTAAMNGTVSSGGLAGSSIETAPAIVTPTPAPK